MTPRTEPPARTPSAIPWGRIGRYQIVAHVATGGMGAVYRAVDVKRGREVALKVLNPEQAAAKPVLLERFNLEARYGRRLNHENVVSLYDYGEEHGIHFLALEYVAGVDLAEYVRRQGKLSAPEARAIMIQATKAIAHLYRHGIIHRDIKPANFLVKDEAGKPLVKLIDLGLARRTTEQDAAMREGSTLGTVDYISPEQARDSDAADIRSDIYSLGCTWFHLLAGRPPFCEGSATDRVYRHVEEPPPDVRQWCPDIPPELLAVLQRMLAKDPAERYQTPNSLLEDLERPQRDVELEVDIDEAPVTPEALAELAGPEEGPAAVAENIPPRRKRGGPRRYREDEEDDAAAQAARPYRLRRRTLVRLWIGAAAAVFLALAGLIAYLAWQSGTPPEHPEKARPAEGPTVPY